MATPSTLGPAPKDVLAPQDVFAQSQLQRRLALAQMLQQNAQEAGGAYGSLNGMRVVPRMGFGPAISQIAQSLLGGYEQKKAMGDQQALYQQMAQRQQQAVDSAYGGSDASGVNPNLGLSKQAFADWYRNNPSEAMKFAAEHQALTDQNRQYVQQGRDLNQVGQLGTAADVVKGTQTFQPGTTNVVPTQNGGSTLFVPADFSKGTVGGYDNNGQPTLQGIQGNQVIAQLAGQQQLANQLNTIQPVTMSNGAVVPMTGAQALGQGSSNVPRETPATGAGELSVILDQAKQMQSFGLPDDQIQAWIRQKAAATPGLTVDPGNGTPVDSTGKPTTAPQLTPIPMAPQANGIGQSTQDKALSDKRAGNIADLEQDINDKAQSAQAKLANNQKLMALVPNITKGPLAGHITDAKNFLNSAGWTGPDPTNNQEFEKYAMQAALESAKQVYGNRITNADLMSLPHWNPSANMTENALNSIINTDNMKQQRLLQRQNVYNDYRNKGGDLNQFNSWFNTNYPDQGVSAPTSLAPGAPVQTNNNAGWSVKRVQ